MRDDMFKVVTERPRHGACRMRSSRGWRLRDVEDGGPARSPLCVKHDKSFNDHLSPLHRFLASRVGQHWNVVYAEICRVLRPRNTLQQHVLDHVKQHVALDVYRRGDTLWVSDRALVGHQPLKESWCRLYVHPVSGVLMRNRHFRLYDAVRRREREAEAARTFERLRVLSATVQLHRLAGHWYKVELAAVSASLDVPRDKIRDAGFSDLSSRALYGRAGVYAHSKRLLGKKELKAHGLQNAP